MSLLDLAERLQGLNTYEKTLAAIDETPRSITNIVEIVASWSDKKIHRTQVVRNIKRAIEGGAAIVTSEGIREPFDQFCEDHPEYWQ